MVRKLENPLELATLQADGKGYIFNKRGYSADEIRSRYKEVRELLDKYAPPAEYQTDPYTPADLRQSREANKIHRATCEAVQAMVTSTYPKYFLETVEEARNWLETQVGAQDEYWVNCGFCGGVGWR